MPVCHTSYMAWLPQRFLACPGEGRGAPGHAPSAACGMSRVGPPAPQRCTPFHAPEPLGLGRKVMSECRGRANHASDQQQLSGDNPTCLCVTVRAHSVIVPQDLAWTSPSFVVIAPVWWPGPLVRTYVAAVPAKAREVPWFPTVVNPARYDLATVPPIHSCRTSTRADLQHRILLNERVNNSIMNALQHNCPSTARTGRSNPYAAQNQTQRVTVRLNFGDPRASLGKGVFRGKRHLLSQPCSAAGDFGHGEGAALENGLSKQYVSMAAQRSFELLLPDATSELVTAPT